MIVYTMWQCMLLLLLLFCVQRSACMMSKRARTWNPKSMTPGASLQAHIRDMYGYNEITAERAQSMMNDLDSVGIPEFAGSKRKLGTNITRGLQRQLQKQCQWPEDYYAQIRVLNKRTGVEQYEWCAFGLPHEYLAALAKVGNVETLYNRGGLDEETLSILQEHETAAGCRLAGLGL